MQTSCRQAYPPSRAGAGSSLTKVRIRIIRIRTLRKDPNRAAAAHSRHPPGHPSHRPPPRRDRPVPGRVAGRGPSPRVPRGGRHELGRRAPRRVRPQAVDADELPRPPGAEGARGAQASPGGPALVPRRAHARRQVAGRARARAAGGARGRGAGAPERARLAGFPSGAARRAGAHRRPPDQDKEEDMTQKIALAAAVAAGCSTTAAFAPRQVTRTYVQSLAAPPDRILPLLTPLGERAWADGWDPTILHAAPAPGAGTVFR